MTVKNTAIKLNNDANLLYKQRKFAPSLELYNQAIESYPDVSQFYANRAQALYQLKKYRECITDCNECIQREPGCWKAYIRSGKAYTKLGELHQAMDIFNRVKEIAKNVGQAQQVADFEISKTQMIMDEVHQAQEAFQNHQYSNCLKILEGVENSMPHNLDIQLLICQCLLNGDQNKLVQQRLKSLKETMELTSEDRERIHVMELKAFAAITATRWKMKDRLRGLTEGKTDLYELLEVARDAQQSVITTAYTRLALQHHPERQAEQVLPEELNRITEIYMRVTCAFVILSDPELRELYDLGFSPEEILDEFPNPASACCGIAHPSSSDPRKWQIRARHCLFWSCLPCVTTTAALCWAPWLCQKQVVRCCTDHKEGDVSATQELQQYFVQQQRRIMRDEGRRYQLSSARGEEE